MIHSPACEARHAAYKAAIAALPVHHCRTCRGSGEHVYNDDPSAHGVSLSAGYMTFSEPCPACVEQGKCPRCGEVAIHDPVGLDDPEDLACEACGWKAGSTPAPEAPECYCWEES